MNEILNFQIQYQEIKSPDVKFVWLKKCQKSTEYEDIS